MALNAQRQTPAEKRRKQPINRNQRVVTVCAPSVAATPLPPEILADTDIPSDKAKHPRDIYWIKPRL